MPHMPKHLGVGPIFQTLETRYQTRATAIDALDKLRGTGGQPLMKISDVGSIAAVPAVNDYQVNPPAPMNTNQLKNHLNKHWFGESDGEAKKTTGWWSNWKGDSEGVLREALVRALELALGLQHGQPTTNASANVKPVQFYWICGLPRFECYVSWSSSEVTVIILTPGWYATLGPDQSPDSPTALQSWMDSNPNDGMIFVGQNVESDGAIVKMKQGVVVHHMDITRDGRGTPFSGIPY